MKTSRRRYWKPTAAERVAINRDILAKHPPGSAMHRCATTNLARLQAPSDPEALTRGLRLALTTFADLGAQRRAMLARLPKLTTAERACLDVLLADLPDQRPMTDDRAAWSAFVTGVSKCVSAVKTLPTSSK
jgi:hypothetical protein